MRVSRLGTIRDVCVALLHLAGFQSSGFAIIGLALPGRARVRHSTRMIRYEKVEGGQYYSGYDNKGHEGVS